MTLSRKRYGAVHSDMDKERISYASLLRGHLTQTLLPRQNAMIGVPRSRVGEAEQETLDTASAQELGFRAV